MATTQIMMPKYVAWSVSMLSAQILDVARPHDSAALEGIETAVDQFRERRMATQPEPERHAESVLGLGDRFRRKNVLQRLLEEIAELEPFHLERGRDLSREFDELVVEQRIANLDARHVAHARHLAQIVVGQRQLEVQVHHAVERRGGGRALVDFAQHGERLVDVDCGQEIRFEHLG